MLSCLHAKLAFKGYILLLQKFVKENSPWRTSWPATSNKVETASARGMRGVPSETATITGSNHSGTPGRYSCRQYSRQFNRQYNRAAQQAVQQARVWPKPLKPLKLWMTVKSGLALSLQKKGLFTSTPLLTTAPGSH